MLEKLHLMISNNTQFFNIGSSVHGINKKKSKNHGEDICTVSCRHLGAFVSLNRLRLCQYIQWNCNPCSFPVEHSDMLIYYFTLGTWYAVHLLHGSLGMSRQQIRIRLRRFRVLLNHSWTILTWFLIYFSWIIQNLN